ncbi:MAG: GHKL domain-containing protein [Cyclobacteriaceae bacterium]|nr:GHKL domain-containing protein [Cyclobacteriaceae bacterium]
MTLLLVALKNFRTWSWSWILFSGAMALLGLVSLRASFPSSLGLTISGLSILLVYLHLIFFWSGVTELSRDRKVPSRVIIRWSLIVALVSIVSVLAYYEGGEYRLARYLLRVGVRTFVTGACFIAAGVVLYRTKRISSGIGLRLMSWSMILFGVEQFYYLIVVVINGFFFDLSFPVFFGVIDLILIFGIGLGMITWLLEDERQKLSKANQELDSFLYSTSHDLRAPIASVLGLTNLARLEMKDRENLTLINMIEQRVKKLDEVISDILKLSKNKKTEVRLEEISLNRLIDEVVADVKFAQDAPAIRLIYDRKTDFVFESDFSIMKTALGNLFSNAVKYHRIPQNDPYIKVAFSQVGNKTLIEVEDNGQGIRPESLDKVFDMFYRASTNSDGTGLGLYIVKEALAKVNGSISVTSNFGQGSTFRIELEPLK